MQAALAPSEPLLSRRLRARSDLSWPGLLAAAVVVGLFVADVARAASPRLAVDESKSLDVTLTVEAEKAPTFQVWKSSIGTDGVVYVVELPGAALGALSMTGPGVLLHDAHVEAGKKGAADRVVLTFADDVDFDASADKGTLNVVFHHQGDARALMAAHQARQTRLASVAARAEAARRDPPVGGGPAADELSALAQAQADADQKKLRLADELEAQKKLVAALEARKRAEDARVQAERQAERQAEIEAAKKAEQSRLLALAKELDDKKAEEARVAAVKKAAELETQKKQAEEARVAAVAKALELETQKKQAEEAQKLAVIEAKKRADDAQKAAAVEAATKAEAARVLAVKAAEREAARQKAEALAAEQKKAEAARLALLADAERKKAEAEIQKKRADEARLLAEQAAAVEAKKRIDEAARAEQARLLEVEAQKEARKKAADDAVRAEQARKTAQLAEEQKKADEARLVDEKRKSLEVQKQLEQRRLHEQAEAERVAEQRRRLQQQADEQRLADERRLTEERRTAEQRRLTAELEAQRRIADDKRRQLDEQRQAQERRQQQMRRLEQERTLRGTNDDAGFGGRSIELGRPNRYQRYTPPNDDSDDGGDFGGGGDDDDVIDESDGRSVLSHIAVQRTGDGARVGVVVDGGARYQVARRNRGQVVLTLFDTRAQDLEVRRTLDARSLGSTVQRVLPSVDEGDRFRIELLIETKSPTPVKIEQDGKTLWIELVE